MFIGHVKHCDLVMLHDRQLRLVTRHSCFTPTRDNTVRVDVLTVMVLKIQVFWEVKQTKMHTTLSCLLDPEDDLPNNTLVICFFEKYAGRSKNISPARVNIQQPQYTCTCAICSVHLKALTLNPNT